VLILCAFHTFILYIVLFLYAAFFVLFTAYVFTVAYITVLLPVGVIKDDDDGGEASPIPLAAPLHRRSIVARSYSLCMGLCSAVRALS